jgi:hypothetical protein
MQPVRTRTSCIFRKNGQQRSGDRSTRGRAMEGKAGILTATPGTAETLSCSGDGHYRLSSI